MLASTTARRRVPYLPPAGPQSKLKLRVHDCPHLAFSEYSATDLWTWTRLPAWRNWQLGTWACQVVRQHRAPKLPWVQAPRLRMARSLVADRKLACKLAHDAFTRWKRAAVFRTDMAALSKSLMETVALWAYNLLGEKTRLAKGQNAARHRRVWRQGC